MKKATLTCPLTGRNYTAIKYLDGRIIATNAITGDDIHITYNASCDRYMVSPEFFQEIPLVSMTECARELNVSKAFVSKLVSSGKLESVKPETELFITRKSLLRYIQGKQKKGKGNGARTGEPDR